MKRIGQAFAIVLAAAASSVAAVAVASAARAEQKAPPVIAEFPPDAEVCYGRQYDAAHLARHPRQKVTALYLFRSLIADPEDEERPKSRAAIAAKNIEWEKT